MTTFGYLFIGCVIILILWSRWLAKKWVIRARDESEKEHEVTVSAYIFPAIIIFAVSSLALPFAISLPVSMYQLVSKPTYEATITRYSSEWVEHRDQNSVSRRTLMHTAYVSFKDQNGQQIDDLPSNIQSGNVPVIGDKISVVYENGDSSVQEKSIRSVLLLSAGTFMAFSMCLILVTILAYALNYNMARFKAIWAFIIFRLIIPVGATSMFAMLLYVLFEYFMLGNPQNLPVWVVAICSFFALSLLPLIFLLITNKRNTDEDTDNSHGSLQ